MVVLPLPCRRLDLLVARMTAYLLQSMNKTKIEESKHDEVKISLSNWKQVSMRRNLVATLERRTKRTTGASYT